MNVKNVEKENGAAKVTIEIARDEFQTALDKAYAKIRKDIMIPGFRKGKAPRKFVERMYGSQVFYEDAVNEIFPEIYKAAITEQEIKAVGQPSVTDMQTPEDGSVVLTVSTELYPEVTLGEYKGIEVPKETVSISKAEVDAELGRMQDRNARIETVDREAKTGDTVVLDFEGFVDGVAFEGGKGENYDLTLGSHQFIPGFEEQVVGHSAGEEFDINVTFPEEYAEELKGKDATFKIKLHEIKQKELPELDDEFVKDVSEFDTLDELKADTKKKMLDHKQEHADEDFEHAVLDQLPALVTAEIPQLMFDRAAQEEFDEFNYRLQSQGIDFDTYLNYTGMERDAMMAMYREQAETNVKTRLALEKIVELEQIEPAEDEIEAEYAKLAENYKMDIDKIKGVIPAADIKANLAMRKAIDLLKEHSVAKKKKATRKKKAATEEKPAEEPKAE